MTLGDLSPTGIAELEGDPVYFVMYHGISMNESEILAHHRALCYVYQVDQDFV